MKKAKKVIIKALSVMLVVAITLTSAPLSGFVGLELPEWLDFSIISSAAELSGACGENLTWTYDSSTYTLTISGTGEMFDYKYDSISDSYNRPWEKYEDYIKNIVMHDYVTSIGNGAFFGCDELTGVKIPKSIISIGELAFNNCKRLVNFTVDSNNQYYSNDEYGVLYNKDKTVLIQYPEGRTGTSYSIPSEVITIGDRAFYLCYRLNSVTIPDSVTIIGNYAFCHCSYLTNITIPDGVTTIGKSAFSSCNNLTSITIPDNVTKIPNAVFDDCYSLTSVIIPDSVMVIDDFAFEDCTSLSDLTIPDSLVTIGNCAFARCSKLANITIPNSVISIGDFAFEGCDSFTSLTIPDSVNIIGCGVFSLCTNLTNIVIPDSVTAIGDSAFSYCTNLTSIAIPDSVTAIGDSAFSYCTNLTSINIPNGITEIGLMSFESCDSLTRITLPDSVTIIEFCAFYSCDNLTSITIPDIVTVIEDYAFTECTNLTDVYYSGTKEQWNNIIVGLNNEPLLNATIHYNSTGANNENVTCCVCGGTYSITTVAPPTCTVSGVKIYTCSSCDNSYTEEMVAMGHNYDATVTAPTCTAGGYTTYTCSVCSDTYTADEVAALGHAIVNGICTVCGDDGSYVTVKPEIKFGADKNSFGKDITGLIGTEFEALVVYTSEKYDISSLTIESSNTDIVEIGSITAGLGGYISIDVNEHKAIVNLKFKMLGTAIVTITDPEGVSESINITVTHHNGTYVGTFKSQTLIAGANNWTTQIIVDEEEYILTPEYAQKLDLTNNEEQYINKKVMFIVQNNRVVFLDTINNIQSGNSELTASIDTGLYAINLKHKDGKFTDKKIEIVGYVKNIPSISEIDSFILSSAHLLNLENIKITITSSDKDIIYFKENLLSSKKDSITLDYESSLISGGFGNFSQQAYVNTGWDFPEGAVTYSTSLTCTVTGTVNGKTVTDSYKYVITFENSDYVLENGQYVPTKEWETQSLIDLLKEMKKEVNRSDLSPAGKVSLTATFSAILIMDDLKSLNASLEGLDKIYEFSCYVYGIKNPSVADVGNKLLDLIIAKCDNASNEMENQMKNVFASLYNSDLFNDFVRSYCSKYNVNIGNMKQVNAHCPIDISVVDEDGLEVVSIVNDVVVFAIEGATAFVNNGKKTIYLPTNINHKIIITATGNGTMDYSVAERNSDDELRVIEYSNINLNNGDVFIGNISKELLPTADVYNLETNSNKEIEYDSISFVEADEEIIDEPVYNYTFSIQTPSRTEIRNKDGIILHAKVDGTAPTGSYVRWESSNSNFDEDANGYDLEIIAKNKGYTTFTAILCAEDGTELARSSVEMYSKSGFFDKIGGFFRSLFGTTKIYEN